jgi:hypothetical protein
MLECLHSAALLLQNTCRPDLLPPTPQHGGNPIFLIHGSSQQNRTMRAELACAPTLGLKGLQDRSKYAISVILSSGMCRRGGGQKESDLIRGETCELHLG